ncbi:hypothetical protein [Cellulosimicrobium cellulans]|nr:hypothetical protein [Cellulosimicrobium cellulans]
MNMIADATPSVEFPATPAWAERTELDGNFEEFAFDPTAPIGQHVAAEYRDNHIEIRLEQMFRRDGTVTTGRPYIYAYVDCGELTSERAREVAAALLAAADTLDRL